MGNDKDMTRRTFLGTTATAAALISAPSSNVAAAAPSAQAHAAPVAPPEVPTPGRLQGTDTFGASVEGVPIIDAHIHLFDGTRPQGATYMGSAA